MAPTHPNAVPDLQAQDRSGLEALAGYPLFEAMRGRRSRRFGRGMRLEHGPLAYASSHAPLPLSETEEALLSYAACGITGHVLADLEYARGRGGTMLANWVGRTIGSGDAVQTVAMVVINDQATYLLKRAQDFAAREIDELSGLYQSAGVYGLIPSRPYQNS